MMRLLNDVYLLSGFAYGLGPNVYAVKGSRGIVLIDTGLDQNDLTVVDKSLAYWGMERESISHVLLTHAHFDHSGNANTLRKGGAVIVASEAAAEGIESGDNRTVDYAFHQRFTPCQVDIKVHDKETVEAGGLTFEVVHAPGHSAGSVVYLIRLDDKVIFFTGDVVRVGPDCQAGRLGWSGAVDYDRDAYLRTLERLSKLECDVLFGGHYQPCLIDGWKILQDAFKVALLEWRPPATYD